MNAGRGVELGIGRAHDRGHGAAGGEARHIDAGRIDRELRHDGAGDARDDAGLALIAHLVRETEPVPASRWIGARRLSRIGDDEAVLLGEAVHPRAQGEVVRVLRAAMQHDDQRQRAALRVAGDIDLVVPRTRFAGEGPREIGRPVRRRDRPRLGRSRHRAPVRRRSAGDRPDATASKPRRAAVSCVERPAPPPGSRARSPFAPRAATVRLPLRPRKPRAAARSGGGFRAARPPQDRRGPVPKARAG